MIVARGMLSDGTSPALEEAVIEADESGTMRIVSSAGVSVVSLAEVRVSDRLGDIPRFLYLPGGGVIETHDNEGIDTLMASRRRGGFSRVIHYLESHRGIATAACIVLVAVLAASLYYGPPKLARSIAFRVPANIESRAGAVALQTIDRFFTASKLTFMDQHRLESQVERLLPDRPREQRPRIVLRSTANLPNAFALPGNTIVVTDELLGLPATDDELAAVLAHEIGHLEKRHGLQSVLRNSFALLIVSAATGDLSALTSFAAALPMTILTNGYARDLEREADAYANELLTSRGIALHHFSSILQKLEKASAAAPQASYLSTHPSTKERIAAFGAPPPPGEAVTRVPKPALNVEQPDMQPVVVHKTAPVYPLTARAKGQTGKVVVDFIVDTQGVVQNAKAVYSSDPDFEIAAVVAVNTWRFKPGKRGNRVVNTHMQVPVVFTLNEDGEAPPGELPKFDERVEFPPPAGR